MSIGTLRENSLHAALKAYYARPSDEIEAKLDGYYIDVRRGDTLLEIQTGSFSHIKRKLTKLLDEYLVLLIYPIPYEKWIVRISEENEPISRRKSPKRGQPVDAFRELLRIPHLLPHPNLTVELVLTREEQVLRDDGKGSWRRKRWSVYDRRLLDVVKQVRLASTTDYLALLPPLDEPFTNKELANALRIRPNLARKITYTLTKVGWLEEVGKRRRAKLFKRASIS